MEDPGPAAGRTREMNAEILFGPSDFAHHIGSVLPPIVRIPSKACGDYSIECRRKVRVDVRGSRPRIRKYGCHL